MRDALNRNASSSCVSMLLIGLRQMSTINEEDSPTVQALRVPTSVGLFGWEKSPTEVGTLNTSVPGLGISI